MSTVSIPSAFENKYISIGKAAEIASLNIIQFKEILFKRGVTIEVGSESVEKLENNVKRIKKLFKQYK